MIPDAPADVVAHAEPDDEYGVSIGIRINLSLIERLTVGVTKETAQDAIARLKDAGIPEDAFVLFPGFPVDRWGLDERRRNLLGLMPPSPVVFGLRGKGRGNSTWWSRNYAYEAARCAPPF